MATCSLDFVHFLLAQLFVGCVPAISACGKLTFLLFRYIGVVLFDWLACFGFDSCLVPAASTPREIMLPSTQPVTPFLLVHSYCSIPSVVTYL